MREKTVRDMVNMGSKIWPIANGEVAQMISLFLRNDIDKCKYIKTSKRGDRHE
jgi:hypothetical protein